jgi:hypothetical protein
MRPFFLRTGSPKVGKDMSQPELGPDASTVFTMFANGSKGDKPFRAKIRFCPLLSESGQILQRSEMTLSASGERRSRERWTSARRTLVVQRMKFAILRSDAQNEFFCPE